MNLRALLLLVLPGLLLAQSVPQSAAQGGGAPTVPSVLTTIVNYSTGQITVLGQGLSPTGVAPTATFNGSALVPTSFGNTSMVASLPSNLAAGTYLLTITNSQNQMVSADITIGAAGPQGFP